MVCHQDAQPVWPGGGGARHDPDHPGGPAGGGRPSACSAPVFKAVSCTIPACKRCRRAERGAASRDSRPLHSTGWGPPELARGAGHAVVKLLANTCPLQDLFHTPASSKPPAVPAHRAHYSQGGSRVDGCRSSQTQAQEHASTQPNAARGSPPRISRGTTPAHGRAATAAWDWTRGWVRLWECRLQPHTRAKANHAMAHVSGLAQRQTGVAGGATAPQGAQPHPPTHPLAHSQPAGQPLRCRPRLNHASTHLDVAADAVLHTPLQRLAGKRAVKGMAQVLPCKSGHAGGVLQMRHWKRSSLGPPASEPQRAATPAGCTHTHTHRRLHQLCISTHGSPPQQRTGHRNVAAILGGPRVVKLAVVCSSDWQQSGKLM